jgi:hypothetical protein
MPHACSIVGYTPKKGRLESWTAAVDATLDRVLTPPRTRVQGWALRARIDHPAALLDDGTWFWRSDLEFERLKTAPDETVSRQWESLRTDASRFARMQRFLGTPLGVVDRDFISPQVPTSTPTLPARWGAVPDVLLSGTDAAIAAHPLVAGIYGRGPQIRLGMAALDAAYRTRLVARTHVIYHGTPGSGKSALLGVWRRLLPPEARVEINAPATTRAGIERLYLDTHRQSPPPVLLCEELDRAGADLLEVLLPLLDDYHEIRRVDSRGIATVKVDLIAVATANDWEGLHRRLGTRLASRFQPIYVPPPTYEELAHILRREVAAYPGGGEDWVQAGLALAADRGEWDVRQILRWLAGGDRLLSGDYQRDLARVEEAARRARFGRLPARTNRFALIPRNGENH